MKSIDAAGRVFHITDTNQLETCDETGVESKHGFSENMVLPDPAERNKCPIVQMSHVGFRYSSRTDTPVLSDLSVSFYEKQFACVVGKSGSGKSTMFGLLCGLHKCTGNGGILVTDQNSRSQCVINDQWVHNNVCILSISVLFVE